MCKTAAQLLYGPVLVYPGLTCTSFIYLVKRPRKLGDRIFVEAHPVLIHAGTHDVLQLRLLDQPVPVNVVNLEEEFHLVVRRLAGKLVHRVNKLLKQM